MKNNLVCLLCVITLFSCSTAYKTSQTPDDVYYSPAQKVIVADNYETYSSSGDDAYLHMKVKDPDKWGSIDDYDYWYDSRYYHDNYYSPYTSSLSLSVGVGYGAYYPYYSYNPYWYNPWYSWYSPYYTVVYYKNPAVYYKPVSTYGLSTYKNGSYNNYNMPLQSGSRSSIYNNSNSSMNKTRSSNFNQNTNSNPVHSFNSGGGGGGGSRISGGGSRTRP